MPRGRADDQRAKRTKNRQANSSYAQRNDGDRVYERQGAAGGKAEGSRPGTGVTGQDIERRRARQRDRDDTQSDRTHRNDRDGRKRDQAPTERNRPEGRSGRRLSAVGAAEAGLQLLEELTSKQTIGVASIESSEDGWVVGIEVVEERRLPSSLDVLAVYEVQVDDFCALVAYRRVKRYTRCQIDPPTVPDQQGPGHE